MPPLNLGSHELTKNFEELFGRKAPINTSWCHFVILMIAIMTMFHSSNLLRSRKDFCVPLPITRKFSA